jgi:hypothetical protein
MKSILMMMAAAMTLSFASSTPSTPEFKLVLGAPIKSASLSGQCPRYKISNKPALIPRFKCRFS